MEHRTESENYVVRFPEKDKGKSKSRSGTSYVLLSLCLFLCGLWLYSEYKANGELNPRWSVECLVLAVPTFFIAAVGHILTKPVSEKVIRVSGETFCFDIDGVKGESHYFTEITKVKSRGTLLMGGKCLRVGDINIHIYIGENDVAYFTMKMENSDRLLQKLMEIGRVPGELAGYKENEWE